MSYDLARAWSHTPGLREGDADADVANRLVVRSPAMRALLGEMDRLIDAPHLLVEGETGTGKDLVARVFHQRAGGGGGPFLELDAPHLSSGCFAAELQRLSPVTTGGTLVVSEILDLSLDHQALLSSALEAVGASHRNDPRGRIVCVTQHDVGEESRRGRLLGALRERLEPYTLRVPALRERPEDLPDLIRSILRELATLYGRVPRKLSPEVWEVLLSHPWNGNVRELRNELERLAVLTPIGRSVGVAALSPALLSRREAVLTPQPQRERRTGSVRRSLLRRWSHPARVPMGARMVVSGEPPSSDEGLGGWSSRSRRRSRRRSYRRSGR